MMLWKNDDLWSTIYGTVSIVNLCNICKDWGHDADKWCHAWCLYWDNWWHGTWLRQWTWFDWLQYSWFSCWQWTWFRWRYCAWGRRWTWSCVARKFKFISSKIVWDESINHHVCFSFHLITHLSSHSLQSKAQGFVRHPSSCLLLTFPHSLLSPPAWLIELMYWCEIWTIMDEQHIFDGCIVIVDCCAAVLVVAFLFCCSSVGLLFNKSR